MTKREAVRQFQQQWSSLYMNHADYWTAEQEWSYYVDSLHRGGYITDRQRETWTTPFHYGKPLKPTRVVLEWVAYNKAI